MNPPGGRPELKEPDLSDPQDKLHRIPSPPLVPIRPEIRWTLKICTVCDFRRTMPEDKDICGKCEEIQERIAAGDIPLVRKKGRPKHPGSRYLDKMREIKERKGMRYEDIKNRIRWDHGEPITTKSLHAVAYLTHRASFYRMELIAAAMGVAVDELYTDRYNDARDQRDNLRR